MLFELFIMAYLQMQSLYGFFTCHNSEFDKNHKIIQITIADLKIYHRVKRF